MLASLRLSLRRAGFGLAGGFFMLIGAGFLTVAAWYALDTLRGPQFAALVIGCAYFGLGALVIAFGMRRRVVVPPPPAFSAAGLSAAFAQGFGAGVATRTAVRPKD